MKKIALLSLSTLILAGCTIGGMSPQKAEKTAIDFIKILAPGAQITVKSMEKAAGGDFKITVDANGQEVISYLSPDGTTFYPQGLDIAKLTKQAAEFKKSQADAATTKPVEGENVTPVEEAAPKAEQAKEEATEDTETPAE